MHQSFFYILISLFCLPQFLYGQESSEEVVEEYDETYIESSEEIIEEPIYEEAEPPINEEIPDEEQLDPPEEGDSDSEDGGNKTKGKKNPANSKSSDNSDDYNDNSSSSSGGDNSYRPSSSPSSSYTPPSSSSNDDDSEGEIIKAKKDELTEEEILQRKIEREAEIKRLNRQNCKLYEGKIIVYYQDFYKVEGCTRHPILDEKTIESIVKSQGFTEVDGEVVASLPKKDIAENKVEIKPCKELNGKYLTVTFSNIYFAENCELRMFVNWESYQLHSNQFPLKQRTIVQIPKQQFYAMRLGKEIELQDDTNKHLGHYEEYLRKIPTIEACNGINNKYVYFYDTVYKIESCKKRKVESKQYQKKVGSEIIPIEISNQIFISLPMGKPL